MVLGLDAPPPCIERFSQTISRSKNSFCLIPSRLLLTHISSSDTSVKTSFGQKKAIVLVVGAKIAIFCATDLCGEFGPDHGFWPIHQKDGSSEKKKKFRWAVLCLGAALSLISSFASWECAEGGGERGQSLLMGAAAFWQVRALRTKSEIDLSPQNAFARLCSSLCGDAETKALRMETRRRLFSRGIYVRWHEFGEARKKPAGRRGTSAVLFICSIASASSFLLRDERAQTANWNRADKRHKKFNCFISIESCVILYIGRLDLDQRA